MFEFLKKNIGPILILFFLLWVFQVGINDGDDRIGETADFIKIISLNDLDIKERHIHIYKKNDTIIYNHGKVKSVLFRRGYVYPKWEYDERLSIINFYRR